MKKRIKKRKLFAFLAILSLGFSASELSNFIASPNVEGWSYEAISNYVWASTWGSLVYFIIGIFCFFIFYTKLRNLERRKQ